MSQPQNQLQQTGIIAWFARNPVAANLLMIIIVVVGIGSASKLQRAMFPMIAFDMIIVTTAYPGAAPEEVEQGVILKIEEAINDVDGIKRVESDAFESLGRVMIEAQDGVDTARLADDIKSRIDGIAHFPEDAERPIVSQPDVLFPALTVQISGDLDERSMKSLADQVRRDLLAYPEISSADVVGARDYEIGIEISEQLLREYHLTLGDVAQRIAASSLDLPAGSVQTRNGDIMLRTMGQAYVQQDFEQIILKTWPDGTRLLLGDIANVDDGFIDAQGFAEFNGEYSLGVNIFAMGRQDIIETAEATKAYVAAKRSQLPAGVSLEIWSDTTYYLEGRLKMMVKNLAIGTLLVFITLALFLEIKLAFWVMVGIPVCFLGAMIFLGTAYIDTTLNMISLFGFILVLGIVVDDAIIIGESVYSEQELHGRSIENVINGVYRVSTPATFGVLTTIIAFTPTLFVAGLLGAMPASCGWVVILCLIFSLIESKWILPAHLAHSKPTRNTWLLKIDRVQQAVNKRLRHFIDNRYSPLLQRCMDYRYSTLAFFLTLLILASGLLTGGVVRTVLSPGMPGEFIKVEIRMSEGSPEERTQQAIRQVITALQQVDSDYKESSGNNGGLVAHIGAYGFDRINGEVNVELTKEDRRDISTLAVEKLWREQVGTIHGADVLSFQMDDGPSIGPNIALDLMHSDFSVLRQASSELEEQLGRYAGLNDIRNGASDTADEFHLDILPEAEALGLTRFDLGSQLRHAFYGAEAQRVQRGIDEIKVMVRYPRADRENVASLNNMFIRTPDGDEVPFDSVASIEVKQGLLTSTRINFERAAEVTADADIGIVEPAKVMADIESRIMPELMTKYPGLRWEISGLSEEENKMAISLLVGFGLALFGIYAVLAIPTRSYLQPLIIMGVIPFGIIGAIVGHWLTGNIMSMMSIMGIIALSGVVVNDSLILVDHVNREVASGTDKFTAVKKAGSRRFRAILLTSMTTFLGLAPMLLEQSSQAKFMVPMAVSLAFGILFATVITLLLVPCLYLVLDDLDRWWNKRGSVEVAST
ncbi:MAG: multidrug efflux pump subunit AcrB [Oceanicoccus sp.]|jgi:multidrug efflux pump subunit AcrB